MLKPLLSRLRESHLEKATLFAQGLSLEEISVRTHIPYPQLLKLSIDPTFCELVTSVKRELKLLK
jgi:hypothetical protein